MRLEVVLHSLRSGLAGLADRISAKARALAAACSLSRGFGLDGAAGIGSDRGSSFDQDDAEVVDVGVGGTPYDEPAGRLEEARRIVIVEELLGVQVARARKRGCVDDGACRVRYLARAAVDAVGVGGQCRYAVGRSERQG